MKVPRVTFISFPVLSFLVCVVMFPPCVFLIYAEVMKLSMISKMSPEGAAATFPLELSVITR